jgi:prepilin-type N-terminal cleavage/methylation domain-containing protein
MMNSSFKYFIKNCKCNMGFTLIEVMVVMVIVAILATGVVFMLADPTAKVKAAAFEMRGDFNLARAEAVKRNENILISFEDGTNDGYRICLDTNNDSDCYDEGDDDIVKDVFFRNGVTFYDFTGNPLPSNGPAKTPIVGGVETPLTGENGIILAGAPAIEFRLDGTCDKSGVVIIYLSQQGALSVIRGKPYAVVVDSTGTGRIRLERWRLEKSD